GAPSANIASRSRARIGAPTPSAPPCRSGSTKSATKSESRRAMDRLLAEPGAVALAADRLAAAEPPEREARQPTVVDRRGHERGLLGCERGGVGERQPADEGRIERQQLLGAHPDGLRRGRQEERVLVRSEPQELPSEVRAHARPQL